MLCVSNVTLDGWPIGQRRDVDPENGRVRGLLRAGYIVPLQPPRRAPDTPLATKPVAPQGSEAKEPATASAEAPEGAAQAARRPRAAKRRAASRTADE